MRYLSNFWLVSKVGRKFVKRYPLSGPLWLGPAYGTIARGRAIVRRTYHDSHIPAQFRRLLVWTRGDVP